MSTMMAGERFALTRLRIEIDDGLDDALRAAVELGVPDPYGWLAHVLRARRAQARNSRKGTR